MEDGKSVLEGCFEGNPVDCMMAVLTDGDTGILGEGTPRLHDDCALDADAVESLARELDRIPGESATTVSPRPLRPGPLDDLTLSPEELAVLSGGPVPRD